jgi:hypothetical protein
LLKEKKKEPPICVEILLMEKRIENFILMILRI